MVAEGGFQADGLSDQEHVCAQAEGRIVIMHLQQESFCEVFHHEPVLPQGVGRQVQAASNGVAHVLKK